MQDLREITSVCECLRVCEADWVEQDLQDLLGFSGWGGPDGTGALVRALDERCERLREIMSVCECLCVWGGLGGAEFEDLLGFSGWGRTCLGSHERWTRVCERLREIMSVCECLRVLGGLGGAEFAGFIGIFRMGEDLLTQVGSHERWTRVCERLREIMRDCECLAVCFLGFSGAGVPPALVRW